MKLLVWILAMSLPTSVFAGEVEWKSIYTSIAADCIEVSSSNQNAPIDFYEAQCKAFGGYGLKIEGGDLRYHPTLTYAGVELEIGGSYAFHDVASDKIEWLYQREVDREGLGKVKWQGLIYRLNIASQDGIGKDKSVLFAVRLNQEKSCLLGTAATNQEARNLVYDLSAPCK